MASNSVKIIPEFLKDKKKIILKFISKYKQNKTVVLILFMPRHNTKT